MEPTSSNCTMQPSLAFLLITIITTAVATAMLSTSIMTEHWEYVTWDKNKLKEFEKNNSSERNDYRMEWLIHGQVAQIFLDFELYDDDDNNNKSKPSLFFVPIRGGIWKFCITINDEEHLFLENTGFPKNLCTNYLKLDKTKGKGLKTDRQHRMQNLCISCALVCLIILGSSALVGIFGISKRQISAILVTGVMYLLAAIFATFSLMIINFKQTQRKISFFNGSASHELLAEGVVASNYNFDKNLNMKKINRYLDARVFLTGWSLHLGWGGTAMCLLVSMLWIILSKIMRYNSFNMLFIT